MIFYRIAGTIFFTLIFLSRCNIYHVNGTVLGIVALFAAVGLASGK
jgi:hypothetical protein